MLKFLKKIYKNYKNNKFKQYIISQHHNVTSYSSNVFDAQKYDFSLSESSTYKLNEQSYKDYITTWEAYQPRMKNNKYFLLSDDKYVFSMTFGNYIEVPQTYAIIQDGNIISLFEQINEENVYDFIVEKNGAVIKDRCGCDGFGIYVLNVKDGEVFYKDNKVDKKKIIEYIKKFNNGIIQSKFTQSYFENELYDKSINTVRVISMRKKGENFHEIVAALQRIGTSRSAPVDNFAQGGGSALIDIETGELGAMTCIDSFDDEGNRIFYDVHPDSGAQIKGKIIPYWAEIKDKIHEVTNKLPFFEYIAWDIVIKEEGIALIETNMKSSLDLFQAHRGMRNESLGQKYREQGYIR